MLDLKKYFNFQLQKSKAMSKKLIKETSYKTDYLVDSPDDEPKEQQRVMTSYREFDELGNITLDIVYLEDGSIDRKYVNAYDQKKLIEEKQYYGEDELSEHNTYEYEGDRLIQSYVHYQDGSKDTVTYKYDEQGLLLSKITVDEDEDMDQLEELVYDQDKLISLKRFEDGDMDSPTLEESWEYDEDGNMIVSVERDYNAERTQKTVYEYDEQGKESEIKVYINDELKEKAIFSRNEKGQAVEIIEEQPGQRMRFLQKFDENGNVVEQLVSDRFDNMLYRIRRKYDESNNLLESEVLKSQAKDAYQMYRITVEHEYA